MGIRPDHLDLEIGAVARRLETLPAPEEERDVVLRGVPPLVGRLLRFPQTLLAALLEVGPGMELVAAGDARHERIATPQLERPLAVLLQHTEGLVRESVAVLGQHQLRISHHDGAEQVHRVGMATGLVQERDLRVRLVRPRARQRFEVRVDGHVHVTSHRRVALDPLPERFLTRTAPLHGRRFGQRELHAARSGQRVLPDRVVRGAEAHPFPGHQLDLPLGAVDLAHDRAGCRESAGRERAEQETMNCCDVHDDPRVMGTLWFSTGCGAPHDPATGTHDSGSGGRSWCRRRGDHRSRPGTRRCRRPRLRRSSPGLLEKQSGG